MATTERIIDWCLLALEEDAADLADPEEMTRADVLEAINEIYQGEIAEALGNIKSATITITAGVGDLPADWVKPHRIYDGDAPDDYPLTQIFDVDKKVADTDDTSQYMLPDNEHIWVHGITPTTGIKAYYVYAPTALTDSALSSPTEIKLKFHRSIFSAYVRQVYAANNGSSKKEAQYGSLVESILRDIESAHTLGKRDDSIQTIENVYW